MAVSKSNYRFIFIIPFLLILIGLLLSSCTALTPQPAAHPSTTLIPPTVAEVSPSLTPVLATSTSTPVPATSTPTPTITATPTATLTPAPRIDFQTKLPADVSAVSYITQPCQVIQKRWDSQNSTPGTIVVPVMIHSIAKTGRPITDDTTITEEYYLRFIEQAHQMGFQTITSQQLVGFLQNNAKIPPLSLMLIVDDRKRAEFFDTYFVPFFKKYNYTVTNAWISHPDTPAYLWKENEPFAPAGIVDFQAHGVIHNIPMDSSVTEDYIIGEIFGPIKPMEDHFGKRPIAFIWPRGLFTPLAVQIAGEADYQIGFTAYPRGPLLFNWIPLGQDEQKAGNPLMVLPRYWDTTAIAALNEAAQISQSAQAFYQDHKAEDLAYYSHYCSDYPAIK
jgi:hypothetical protein